MYWFESNPAAYVLRSSSGRALKNDAIMLVIKTATYSKNTANVGIPVRIRTQHLKGLEQQNNGKDF